MQLPNKLFNYSESIFSKFPVVLKSLEKESLSVGIFYIRLQKHFSSINDFIEVLDALYALEKIDYDEEANLVQSFVLTNA